MDGVDGWSGYPLDCYDYLSTCGAKNGANHDWIKSCTIFYDFFYCSLGDVLIDRG